MNYKERINFIIEYISAYEEKIKMCNKNGLFDEAKMFELFAKEVCKLIFNQDFINLNDLKPNYPFFDLVSIDKKIYVQVSTEQYIQTKIKKTLENIRDSKNQEISSITEAYFFMLDNNSVKSVKDIVGKNQIGNIPFVKSKNLITTQDLISKSKNDLSFQEQFYSLIKKEFDNYNDIQKRFYDELNNSKNVGLKNIDTLINNEYEIDRTELIEKIKNENKRFISIQGCEGSGKSALCKKIVQNEDFVLFARAERFVEESHIDKIWNININQLLELLNGKKITFFIDALEFIADAPKTKIELLQTLYSIVNEYDNAYIITSCRNNDKNAFLRIESNYPINTYYINEITSDELNIIEEKYSIIEELDKNKSYHDLLKTPFYINLIISKKISYDDIENINKFRMYIWENIICIKNKTNIYDLQYSDVVREIEKIVFNRAKNFLLGIDESDLNEKIINALLIEGVLITGKYGIRLKYDIYEDICFEYFFDQELKKSKGNYNAFFTKIEELGRSVYRRYQIWISNKLFALSDKEEMIYRLLFSDDLSEKWKKQTEIGIVKSDYCSHFFDDYEMDLIQNDLLAEYLMLINMYSYDINLSKEEYLYNNLNLVPIGNGRKSIIRIIKNNELYKENTLNKNSVIKLCKDCSKQPKSILDQSLMNNICDIIEYYVEKDILDELIPSYKKIEHIRQGMLCLFYIATYSQKWLSNFINQLIIDIKSDDDKKNRFAEDMCELIFKNCYPSLAKSLGDELCNLANTYWFKDRNNTKRIAIYGERESLSSLYGLSEYAENYNFDYKYSFSNIFIYNIFRVNFRKAFEWAIDFINTAVSNYTKNSNYYTKITIKFNNKDEKTYVGNASMWLAGIEETNVPEIIGDIIYQLKNTIINIIETRKNDEKYVFNFLNYIKETIYDKSNNVILLNIIETIGLQYERIIPGYLINLCTSMHIINWDVHRYSLYMKNPIIDELKKRILLQVGIPKLESRYELNKKCSASLIDYMQRMQLYYGEKCKKEAYFVFDYLYSIIPNDSYNAIDYLQIQKMDLRNAKQTPIKDDIVLLESNITGEAKKIADNYENSKKSEWIFIKKTTDILTKNSGEDIQIEELVKEIYHSLELCQEDSFRLMNESNILALMAAVLKSDKLNLSDRNVFCNYWIDDIEKLFINENSNSNYLLFPVLIDQLKFKIEEKLNNRIKRLLLDIIINENENGIIAKYEEEVRKYLKSNKSLSIILFNTIVKISEDEMNHQKYNAEYLNKTEKYNYVPNMDSRLDGVNMLIRDKKGKPFESKKEDIIEQFLYNEKKLKSIDPDINNYDIELLCNICCCEQSIRSNPDFKNLLKNMIIDINKLLSQKSGNRILDLYSQAKIVNYFHEKMIRDMDYNEELINMLFDEIDFSLFKHDNYDFYEYIFADFPVLFFDGYNDIKIRNICIKKLLYIEKKINSINNDSAKIQLCKLLTFHIYRFYHWDIAKVKTKYSYKDKMFINRMIQKYGKYHIDDIFITIYQMNLIELLPEILISLKDVLSEKDSYSILSEESKKILDMIIINSFTNYCDEIKKKDELIKSYEIILEYLIMVNNEKAGVLLDEFRVH